MGLEWDEKTFTKFTYLSDIRISHDSSIVTYTLTKADLEKDKYENTVVIEYLGERTRKYIDNASMARPSPNGKELLVVKTVERNHKSTILLYELETLTYRKLREYENLAGLEWSPNGRLVMAVTTRRRGDENLFFEDRTPVWFDSKGFLDGEKGVIQVLDKDSAEILDEVMINYFLMPYFKPAVWHGEELVYAVPLEENPYKLFEVYIHEVGGKSEKILDRASLMPIHSNGKEILMLGKPKKKFLSEHEFPYIWKEGGLQPLVEGIKYEVSSGLLDAGGNAYLTLMEEGNVLLYKAVNGGLKELIRGNLSVTEFDVSDSGKVALLMETDTKLAEVHILEGGELKQLTDYNGPVLKALGTQPMNHFRFNSLGLSIDGWFIKPSKKVEKGKTPVIVFVHGGPKGMYGYRFRYDFQLMANRGYYVVFVNPRGSAGYDEEFALKVLHRTGLEDFQDILNGVKKFLNLVSDADPDRVGVTGISYGGFMTNWAVTHSELFKAGISENGISYWLTSYAFSDIGLWFDKEVIGDEPLRNENYRKLSPLFNASKVKASLLLIHSLEDYRCPLDQSVMFYHVLKALGKDVYIAIFKKGPHGHSIKGTPKHRMKRYKLITEFFDRKLMKGEEFNVDEVFKSFKKS